jgi:hypothetical protein
MRETLSRVSYKLDREFADTASGLGDISGAVDHRMVESHLEDLKSQ